MSYKSVSPVHFISGAQTMTGSKSGWLGGKTISSNRLQSSLLQYKSASNLHSSNRNEFETLNMKPSNLPENDNNSQNNQSFRIDSLIVQTKNFIFSAKKIRGHLANNKGAPLIDLDIKSFDADKLSLERILKNVEQQIFQKNESNFSNYDRFRSTSHNQNLNNEKGTPAEYLKQLLKENKDLKSDMLNLQSEIRGIKELSNRNGNNEDLIFEIEKLRKETQLIKKKSEERKECVEKLYLNLQSKSKEIEMLKGKVQKVSQNDAALNLVNELKKREKSNKLQQYIDLYGKQEILNKLINKQGPQKMEGPKKEEVQQMIVFLKTELKEIINHFANVFNGQDENKKEKESNEQQIDDSSKYQTTSPFFQKVGNTEEAFQSNGFASTSMGFADSNFHTNIKQIPTSNSIALASNGFSALYKNGIHQQENLSRNTSPQSSYKQDHFYQQEKLSRNTSPQSTSKQERFYQQEKLSRNTSPQSTSKYEQFQQKSLEQALREQVETVRKHYLNQFVDMLKEIQIQSRVPEQYDQTEEKKIVQQLRTEFSIMATNKNGISSLVGELRDRVKEKEAEIKEQKNNIEQLKADITKKQQFIENNPKEKVLEDQVKKLQQEKLKQKEDEKQLKAMNSKLEDRALQSEKREEIAAQNIKAIKEELFEVLDNLKQVMENGGLINNNEEKNVEKMIVKLNEFIQNNIHLHKQIYQDMELKIVEQQHDIQRLKLEGLNLEQLKKQEEDEKLGAQERVEQLKVLADEIEKELQSKLMTIQQLLHDLDEKEQIILELDLKISEQESTIKELQDQQEKNSLRAYQKSLKFEKVDTEKNTLQKELEKIKNDQNREAAIVQDLESYQIVQREKNENLVGSLSEVDRQLIDAKKRLIELEDKEEREDIKKKETELEIGYLREKEKKLIENEKKLKSLTEGTQNLKNKNQILEEEVQKHIQREGQYKQKLDFNEEEIREMKRILEVNNLELQALQEELEDTQQKMNKREKEGSQNVAADKGKNDFENKERQDLNNKISELKQKNHDQAIAVAGLNSKNQEIDRKNREFEKLIQNLKQEIDSLTNQNHELYSQNSNQSQQTKNLNQLNNQLSYQINILKSQQDEVNQNNIDLNAKIKDLNYKLKQAKEYEGQLESIIQEKDRIINNLQEPDDRKRAYKNQENEKALLQKRIDDLEEGKNNDYLLEIMEEKNTLLQEKVALKEENEVLLQQINDLREQIYDFEKLQEEFVAPHEAQTNQDQQGFNFEDFRNDVSQTSERREKSLLGAREDFSLNYENQGNSRNLNHGINLKLNLNNLNPQCKEDNSRQSAEREVKSDKNIYKNDQQVPSNNNININNEISSFGEEEDKAFKENIISQQQNAIENSKKEVQKLKNQIAERERFIEGLESQNRDYSLKIEELSNYVENITQQYNEGQGYIHYLKEIVDQLQQKEGQDNNPQQPQIQGSQQNLVPQIQEHQPQIQEVQQKEMIVIEKLRNEVNQLKEQNEIIFQKYQELVDANNELLKNQEEKEQVIVNLEEGNLVDESAEEQINQLSRKLHEVQEKNKRLEEDINYQQTIIQNQIVHLNQLQDESKKVLSNEIKEYDISSDFENHHLDDQKMEYQEIKNVSNAGQMDSENREKDKIRHTRQSSEEIKEEEQILIKQKIEIQQQIAELKSDATQLIPTEDQIKIQELSKILLKIKKRIEMNAEKSQQRRSNLQAMSSLNTKYLELQQQFKQLKEEKEQLAQDNMLIKKQHRSSPHKMDSETNMKSVELEDNILRQKYYQGVNKILQILNTLQDEPAQQPENQDISILVDQFIQIYDNKVRVSQGNNAQSFSSQVNTQLKYIQKQQKQSLVQKKEEQDEEEEKQNDQNNQSLTNKNRNDSNSSSSFHKSPVISPIDNEREIFSKKEARLTLSLQSYSRILETFLDAVPFVDANIAEDSSLKKNLMPDQLRKVSAYLESLRELQKELEKLRMKNQKSTPASRTQNSGQKEPFYATDVDPIKMNFLQSNEIKNDLGDINQDNYNNDSSFLSKDEQFVKELNAVSNTNSQKHHIQIPKDEDLNKILKENSELKASRDIQVFKQEELHEDIRAKEELISNIEYNNKELKKEIRKLRESTEAVSQKEHLKTIFIQFIFSLHDKKRQTEAENFLNIIFSMLGIDENGKEDIIKKLADKPSDRKKSIVQLLIKK